MQIEVDEIRMRTKFGGHGQWRSWVEVDARAHLNVGGASGRVN